MNQIIILIFNIIIVSNACFTFKNSTDGICNTYVSCIINNSNIKIDTIACDPHSHSNLFLTMDNFNIMEKFFLFNTETVDKFFNLFRNDSYTLLYIRIKNGTSPRRKKFRINNKWLKKLFARYKSFYSVFILNMMFKRLPRIKINATDLMEFVDPHRLMWLQFNISRRFCSIQIRTNQIRDDMYRCINSPKHTSQSQYMLTSPLTSSTLTTVKSATESSDVEKTTSVSIEKTSSATIIEEQSEIEEEGAEEGSEIKKIEKYYTNDFFVNSSEVIDIDYNWNYSQAGNYDISITTRKNKTNYSSLWISFIITGIITVLIAALVYYCIKKNRDKYTSKPISQPVSSYYSDPTLNNEK